MARRRSRRSRVVAFPPVALAVGGAMLAAMALGWTLAQSALPSAERSADRASPPTTPQPEVTLVPPHSQPSAPDEADPYRIELRIRGEAMPADLWLMPDLQPVELEAVVTVPARGSLARREAARQIQWRVDAGTIEPLGGPDSARARFRPPERSTAVTVTARLVIELEAAGGRRESVVREASRRILSPSPVSLLVRGQIDGFRIGEYLDPTDPQVYRRYRVESAWPRKYPDKYRPPAFFYKVTPDLKALRIAPHQTLGFWIIDFPWKSLGETQYLALDLNLVRKLEDLIALMREDGRQVTHFVPIYGFRPPAFNLTTIEEHPDTNLKEPFSMHQYGRAVDLIVDEDGDGVIDDLNGDGKIDIHDAAVIMHYVNILDRRYRQEGRMAMVGGAGLYDRHDFVERPRQTPYVHIDTRGFLRDDGTLVRWPDRWPDGTPIRWGSI